MSDLIDRSALIKELINKNIPPNRRINDIIMAQPVAYDIDAVVEQLEDRSTLSRPVGWSKAYEIITLEDAIRIVRAGGKE